MLIVNYVGQNDDEVADILETKPAFDHPFPFCCLPKIKPGRKFLLKCHQFILQFVFVKPAVSFSVVLTNYLGTYGDGEFTVSKAYPWLTLADNISITLSLYFLVLYYMASKEELEPFKPVGKFLCIKAVVFFSFWQGVALSVLAHFDIVSGIEDWSALSVSRSLQDFIICFEMLGIAIIHHYVFSYKDFRDPEKVPFLYNHETKRFFSSPSSSMKPLVKNFMSVTSVHDIIADTKRSFLQRHTSESSSREGSSSSIITESLIVHTTTTTVSGDLMVQ